MGTLGQPTEAYWQRMFESNSTRSADRLAAVFGCVQVISSAIAAMPLRLHRKNGKTREHVSDHPVARWLDGRPNDAMTWHQFREGVHYATILRGNQHSRVFWRNGYPIEVFPIPHGSARAKLTDARRLIYEVSSNDFKVPTGKFSRPDIAHFKGLTGDGINGISPIEHCRSTIGAALALSDYGKNSATAGGPISGILTMKTAAKSADAAKEARRLLNEATQEARRNSGIILAQGAEDSDFFPVTMSMRDAQYLESMQFGVIEICRIFNVPPHKIHDLTRATFSNIEHLSLEFYTGCLIPWITRFEATYNECFLTEADRKAGYYFRHNADALLRGDLASRSDSYQKQVTNGILTPNEARALEERDPVDGGDRAFFPINHTVLSQVGNQTSDAPTP